MNKVTKEELLERLDEIIKWFPRYQSPALQERRDEIDDAIRSLIENMDKKPKVTKRELMDAISESEWQKTWNPIYNLFKANNIEIDEEEKEASDE